MTSSIFDQYRALTKQYGFEDGEVMFINKYPEFFRVTEIVCQKHDWYAFVAGCVQRAAG